ncbi:GNAT family N-acetyltransferase [Cohnella thailandensis]|uniref:GNAT family N-acetyltransferase n=1 Tax=Cohnella thailandensis TaxID=557557 RepID=A0A841T8S8_9BACL|nr:GNAT family N-acetyltransferase [Cohnella thailandensis]MBB6638460.1 GNAT family N-acetyltransferase [Cohnella thailandensis]MBP1977480.1 ribosomal protein S18 acetylase RimI-like enzyme [Cohnella thailandensis]
MRIERLQLSDRNAAEELWSLQHSAYRIEAQLIGVTDLPPLHDTIDMLRGSSDVVFGARDESNELVGAVAVEEGEHENTISKLMVHPNAFRRGVGSRLLKHALAAYPEEKTWLLTAEIRNKPAIALYEKAGFRAIDTLKPREDITLLLMRLEESS